MLVWRSCGEPRIIATYPRTSMKLVCVWIAVLLSLPPAGWAHAHTARSWQSAETPAQESRTPASVIGTKDERAEKAANLYDKGRFVEAALEFEGLVKDYPQDTSFLFNAAVSRFGAGHYAHTVAYTREYLAGGALQPGDRKEAEEQLAEALAKVAPIRVTVHAPAGGPAEVTVVAQHVARTSSDLRPELLFPVTLSAQLATVELELDPGAWTLRVEGPGYERQEQRVELAQGVASAVEFTLAAVPASAAAGPGLGPIDAPPPVAEVPRPVVRRMQLGFGVAGGAAVVAGIVVPIVGAVRVKGLDSYDCKPVMGASDPYAVCRADWAAAYRTRDAGLAVLGGGLGLLGGGLTWMIQNSDKRRKAFIAEAAVGGVALVGGFASLFATVKPFNELNQAPDWEAKSGGIAGRLAPHAVSMTAFGFGLGLLTSAVVGLGVQRKHVGTLRAGAVTGPGQASLVLSGSF